MTDYNCCHCFREIKSPSYAVCSGCKLHLHYNCIGMSEREASLVLSLKTTNVKILCNRCDKELLTQKQIIDKIDTINSSLDKRLSDIEKLIQSLNSMNANKEEIITESVERSLRSRNVILLNVPENSGCDDAELVNDILAVIDESAVVHPEEVSRIGKVNNSNNKRPRLIKLRFKTVELAKLVLRKSKALKDNERFNRIMVRDDKTPQQINYLKKLNEELHSRRSKGEKDLTIKYINNLPRIITSTPEATNIRLN